MGIRAIGQRVSSLRNILTKPGGRMTSAKAGHQTQHCNNAECHLKFFTHRLHPFGIHVASMIAAAHGPDFVI